MKYKPDAQHQQVIHKKWTQWAESKSLLPETVAYEAMRLAFEAGALTAAPSAQAEPRHSTTWSGDCPHWCKACATERAERK